jgi:cystathionine beta-lyase
MHGHGIYGYYGDDRSYYEAICWWMKTRHNWEIDPTWIFSTHGLVNGMAMCVDCYTQPGDGVILMTPVYHSFFRVLKASGREVVECSLANNAGRYEMDFETWDTQLTGNEKMLVLCSPHNPGGRVWSRDELRGVAAFAKRHDLILVSDEIHHDLTFPGQTHIPMTEIDGDITDRLIMMTASTKTFNIAGAHTGNVIIPDPHLRAQFGQRMTALGLSPNRFGLLMAEAAYSPEGANWVDELMAYIEGNKVLFDATIAEIKGVTSMPLDATYLAWVDFSGTGMARHEFTERVEKDARIAVNHGTTFGAGGASYLRFNIATPRSRIQEACTRLRAAFRDLQ